MKKVCGSCQYWREPGQMDADIPGSGQWCSNSQSVNFRKRVKNVDWCNVFSARGKRAGLGLRLKAKGLGAGEQGVEEEIT